MNFIGWILISKLFALLIDHKKETIKPADFYCTIQIYKEAVCPVGIQQGGIAVRSSLRKQHKRLTNTELTFRNPNLF